MKSAVEDISPVKKKLLVEIEADEVTKKVSKAYRDLGKKAKIPGFRSGKIPRKILERYYGKEVIEDVTKALVNETLPMAMEENNTFPLSMPVIENETLKVGQKFKYSFVMEVKPEFELKNYTGLEVEKEICRVKDEDVARELQKIRENSGKLNSIEQDRPIKENDYAIIEYEGFEDKKALEGVKSLNFMLKIGSNDFHPDFEKALIGHKKGDSTEITVDFEEDHYHAKLAGKTVDFKVNITDIKEMELPELNDEFVKNLGVEFDTLEELKKKVREEIINSEEKRIDTELKKRLLKKISDSVDFELPESLVDSEVQYAVENIKQNLSRMGSNVEQAGLNEEKLRENLRPASETRVKDMLILGEMAKQNSLDIDEVELSEGFRGMALSMGQEPGVLRKYYEANNLVDSFRQKLLEEKTLNFLAESAKVSEVTADKMTPEAK